MYGPPFELFLAPRTFTKCMDVALSSLRQKGISIPNLLYDWLILAQSKTELDAHRSLLPSHLKCLGHRINIAKSLLSSSQRISFLGVVLTAAQIWATLTPEQALTIQQLAASFRVRVSSAGPASHEAPTVLAETPNPSPGIGISDASASGWIMAASWP